jgi:hypothetical protein
MSTTVVNVKTSRQFDVYIGRVRTKDAPGLWGNPFKIGQDGNRAQVIAKFRAFFYAPEQAELRHLVKTHLTGMRLGCFCKPLACHGDIYAEYCDSAGEVQS